MASGAVKKATAIVGYAVIPNAREVLCNIYGKTLNVLSRLPKDVAYRRHTEVVVRQRLQIVQGETSIPAIEKKINCGQVEELVDQAERELSLANKMEEWKPWEPLVGEPPSNQWKWP